MAETARTTTPGYAGSTNIDIAHDLATQIPPGRWTSYGELANAVMIVTGRRDTNGYQVALGLLPREHAPWHRLRDRHGVYNSVKSDHDPLGTRHRFDDRLRAEGCAVDERDGAADPHKHITASRLLDHAGTPAERLHAARQRDPELNARVAARRAARRAEHPLG
jgi:alkylated DNA nucleotide flippase Atl1